MAPAIVTAFSPVQGRDTCFGGLSAAPKLGVLRTGPSIVSPRSRKSTLCRRWDGRHHGAGFATRLPSIDPDLPTTGKLV